MIKMRDLFFNNLNSPYEVFFNAAASCQMDGITVLYNYIMSYLTAILGVVSMSLVCIILIHLHGSRHLTQFKKEENLGDLLNWLRFLQRWTHSTTLELIWTILPTLVLIAIAVPSFILLYSLDEIVDTQSIVKIIGFQWYWKYEYPVFDALNEEITTFSYLSYMLPFEDLTEEKSLRLLEVDSPLVLPTNVNSKLIITAKDVLHSFAVPALGLKMDAVPGRLNQITVHIFKGGMFYGQCSELCGVNHGFMPIVVAAVDLPAFEHFLAKCAGFDEELVSPETTSKIEANPEVNPKPDCPTGDCPEPEYDCSKGNCPPSNPKPDCPTGGCSSWEPTDGCVAQKCVTGDCPACLRVKKCADTIFTSVTTPDGVEHPLVPIRRHYAYYLADAPKLTPEEVEALMVEIKKYEDFCKGMDLNVDRIKAAFKKIYYNHELEEHQKYYEPIKLHYIQNLIQTSLLYNYLGEAIAAGEEVVSPQNFYCRQINYLTAPTPEDWDAVLAPIANDAQLMAQVEKLASHPSTPFTEYRFELIREALEEMLSKPY